MTRLFSSFEQAESGTSRKFGGTGLGLAISKSIVEMMDGKIWVDSEPDQGSKFSFTFKVQRADRETAKKSAKDSKSLEVSNNDFSAYRVLMAEDVEINQEIVLALLEPTGLQIDCADNGAIALELFSQNPDVYDIIFMDVQMPQMDGFEATQQIRSLGTSKAKEIPILAMTANVFKEDIEKCLAAGMNDHVGKPIDIAEVIAKLHNYLPKR
ncbi:hypothetical protein FACS1894104_4500 [Actinomycetota bacterium]|nr:hypothetical protein FACS1894104_4500 [Actinomycetota bacterium]